MMQTQDIPTVGPVIRVLEAEVARLGIETPLGEMFSDWASLLRGKPAPFALPWDMEAALSA